MSDFAWLAEQIKAVKTNNFFVVDGPAKPGLKKRVQGSQLGMPDSYKQFVLQFGNAKLYRSREQYLVEVFAAPHDIEGTDGEPLWQFGKTDEGPVYFKKAESLHEGMETPVWEWSRQEGFCKAADSFAEWLFDACKLAQRQFNKKRWAEIVAGPPAFSSAEIKIIEARRHFKWSVVGIDPDGDLLFEVFNGSDQTLPYLTLGVRGKQNRIEGGTWLPVSNVAPGEKRTIKKGCYKNLLPSEQVIVFDEVDPTPETRDRYWEFKAL